MALGSLRIKPKLLLVLFLINAAFTVAFSWYSYNRQKKDILQGIDQQLTIAAYGAAHVLPLDFHAKIEGKDSVSRDEYMKYMRILTLYANETGLSYLYTCMRFGDAIVFTMSSVGMQEVREGTIDEFFEVYDSAPDSMRRAFDDMKIHFDEYTDKYGTFRSVFIPVASSNRKVYVVGADVPVGFVARRLHATLVHTSLIGLIIFVLAFFVEYFMIDRIVTPLAQLTGYTRVLVKQDFTLGEEVLRDMQNIAEAREGEVSDLAGALHGMYAMLQTYIVNLKETTAAREAVESELRIARGIQTSLLPRTFPPFPDRKEFGLHAVNVPAKHVAGDFFDFYFVSTDRLLITIADVSGKGVPAALLMAVTRTLLKNLVLSGLGPGEALTKANRVLAEDNDQGMFVTLFLAVYETDTGRVRYANAGHNPPYHLDAAGKLAPPLDTTGCVLGIMEEQKLGEKEIRLAPGDLLVLYTDGVTEACAPDDELYGKERFEELLSRNAGEKVERLCDIIIDTVSEFQQQDLHDDVTLLVLRRNE